jgi:hypothetical protein
VSHQELFTLYGWTPTQWRKAIKYHDLLCPEAPFGRPFHMIVEVMKDNNLKRWEDLRKFWEARRKDAPMDVEIILPGEKGWL